YSHDGRIALANRNDQLSAFSVPDGRRLWQVAKRHDSALPLTPDGCCVLVTDPGGRWRALRLADGSDMQPAPPYLEAIQSAPTDHVRRLEFSPDGLLFAVGPRLLETSSGTPWRDLVAGPSAVTTFDPSNRLLARLSGRSLTLFNRAGGE